MKIISTCLVSSLLIISSFNCYSQIDKPISKGNCSLGGGIGISFSNEKQSDSNVDNLGNLANNFESNSQSLYLSISPSVGYFFTKGLLIGISPRFGYSNNNENYHYSNDNQSSYDSHGFDFGGALFSKYYFNKGLVLGFDSGFLLNYDYYDYFNSSYSDQKTSSVAISYNFNSSISFGYAFFINSKVSLEPNLNYTYYYETIVNSMEELESNASSSIRVITNSYLSFNISLNVFL